MKITISKRALRQIERVARWWSEHRPAARWMLLDELAAAERLLRGHPEAGIVYAAHRAGIVRRILLGGTKYHLYYRYQHPQHDLRPLATPWQRTTDRVSSSTSCSVVPVESIARSRN